MQHMLLMISSQAPAGETAAEPARTPIRKPGSPNWMMHVASRADGLPGSALVVRNLASMVCIPTELGECHDRNPRDDRRARVPGPPRRLARAAGGGNRRRGVGGDGAGSAGRGGPDLSRAGRPQGQRPDLQPGRLGRGRGLRNARRPHGPACGKPHRLAHASRERRPGPSHAGQYLLPAGDNHLPGCGRPPTAGSTGPATTPTAR
jgi:hypothetical protein